jgi:hypothetical protein
MNTNITFSLSDTQKTKYLEWRDTVLKDEKHDITGIRECFIFIPCSTGVAVKVKYGENVLDLTEYDKLSKK